MRRPTREDAYTVIISPSAWSELAVIPIEEFREVERALRRAAEQAPEDFARRSVSVSETLRVGDFLARLEIDPATCSLVLAGLDRR